LRKIREGKRLKEYLNRINTLTVRLQTHDEEMVIASFEQGMEVGPFNDSLIRNPTETFYEVRKRAVMHIEVEEVVLRKNDNSCSRKPKPKERNRYQPLQVHETSVEKRINSRYVSYVDKKDESWEKAREEPQARPKFRVSYKELLGMPGVVDKLKFAQKTKQNLGS